LLALDVATGAIRWHFQFTPHDTHDWDATEIPVLVDLEWEGRARRLVVMANRNAFYYVLDRETGEFLHGQEYSKQTWARGLDASGRPIVIPGSEPTVEGSLVWPSLQGATNWFSPSYSPLTETLYVPVRHMGAVYYKGSAEYIPGRPFLGGGEQARTGDEAWGYVKALDVKSGDIAWEHKLLTPRHGHRGRPRVRLVERGKLLRARRRDGRVTLGHAGGRAGPLQPDVVRARWPPAGGDIGGQRCIRAVAALKVGRRCTSSRITASTAPTAGRPSPWSST
jgi:hypothetical protein